MHTVADIATSPHGQMWVKSAQHLSPLHLHLRLHLASDLQLCICILHLCICTLHLHLRCHLCICLCILIIILRISLSIPTAPRHAPPSCLALHSVSFPPSPASCHLHLASQTVLHPALHGQPIAQHLVHAVFGCVWVGAAYSHALNIMHCPVRQDASMGMGCCGHAVGQCLCIRQTFMESWVHGHPTTM